MSDNGVYWDEEGVAHYDLETPKENRDVVYIDLESSKGNYWDVRGDTKYKFSTAKGVLPNVYMFNMDNSGDNCPEYCALYNERENCKTCLECFNNYAYIPADKEQEMEVEHIEIDNQVQPWERDIRELEKSVAATEEIIAGKQDEIKELKKQLNDQLKQMRQLIELGSEEYQKAHPLFEGLE